MELINSQYRVIEILEEDKFGSKYLVQDMYKENMVKHMRVIDSIPETLKFIEYMKVNFFDYVNIVHPNITKIYYFNRVRAVNTKPILSNRFYYTYEHFQGRNIFEYAKGKDIGELLDIISQLCSAIKYLHLRGFVLCSINTDDIYVIEKEGKKQVKISTLPYPISIDNSIIINKDNPYFKSPEALQFGQYGIANDIYILGMIMYHMLSNRGIGEANFRERLWEFKPSIGSDNGKVKKILEKCILAETSDRYSSVDEVIKDINNAFNKTYNIVDKKYIQKLPLFATKLVGRECFIKSIMEDIRKSFYEKGNIKATVVTGDFGTGKGAFLNALLTRINHEGEYAVYSVLKKDSCRDYSTITDIIKKILKYVDKELIDKYLDQLGKIIPEILTENQTDFFYLADKEEEAYKITYRLGNFLLEASLKRSFIIVIKNYEYIDECSKRIINYIMANQNKGKTYFIISFDEKVSQEDVTKSFSPYLSDFEVGFICLSNFNIYETAEAIGILLGMDRSPIKFAAMVYEKTQGNPYFIHETIYALFWDNHIFVDSKGQWVLDNVDFTKINLSVNVDEILQNKISKLEPIKKEILNIMSVFTTAVSVDILEDMLDMGIKNIAPILESLIYINILSQKMDDWGISYDYNSVSLKKGIYESLSDYSKFKYHEKASKILEEKFSREKRENKDELVYHMLKSGRREEAVEYLIISSDEMVKKNLFNQAIQFLEQSYNFIDKDDMCEKKLEICLKLGDLYYQTGEYDKCHQYYKIAENDALITEDKLSIIDIYIKMVKLNYKIGNVKKCLEYSRTARKEIKNIDYKDGMLDLILALNDLMMHRRKYSSYMKIVKKALKSLDGERNYYYGMLMLTYGNLLAKKYHYEEALNALNQSIEILEELKEYDGLASALNTMGTIYTNYYNDFEKAKEYFQKTLKICLRINNIPLNIYSYNNLGEMYRIEEEYNKSLEYYTKALSLGELTKNIYVQTAVHINCAMISIQMEDFKKYIQHIDKAKTMLFKYKDSGEVMKDYYIHKAVFHYIMGGFEDALDYAQKSVDMGINWGIQSNFEANMVINLCIAKLYEDMNFEKLEEFCLDVFNKKRYTTCRQACHNIAEMYIDQKFYNRAKIFLNISGKCKEFINTQYMDIEYRYLSIMTYEEEKKVSLLLDLINIIDRIDKNEIKWKIYYSIGLELLNLGDFQGALNYLLKSFNYLRILTDGVPKEYKIKFLLSHNRSSVKENILKIAQKVTGREGLVHRTAALNADAQDIDQCINKYFDYKIFKDLVSKSQNDGYRSDMNMDISMQEKFMFDFLDRISRFGQDPKDNIKELIEFFINIIQAKNAFLSIIDENNETKMLYSKLSNKNSSFYKYIIEKTRQSNENIIITDVFEYKKKIKDSIIPKDICAVFCMPIMPSAGDYDFNRSSRRNDYFNNIKGYLYFDTDSIINNFSEETAELCVAASRIAYILIDNYNLKEVTAVDKLTRLYTRKYFEHSLQKEILNASLKKGEFSIIMMDVDKFKNVNDRFGHQIGDEVLSRIASIVMENVRKTDICGRYGGEEFILLLPSTGVEGAFNLAEKLRQKVESSNVIINHNAITISIGISTYPEHSIWMKDLIDKADQALYYSKENGRNKTTIYDANMKKTVKRVDKLAGIVSGNMMEDMRNVETMIETLELQRDYSLSLEEKIFSFLGRIIEVSEAETGSIFIIDENKKPIKQISRKSMINQAVEDIPYNNELLIKCIETLSGGYVTDWDSSVSFDTVTGMPNWQSKMLIPITSNDKLYAVLYLSVSLNNKEFDANIYNFIKTLCEIITPIFLNNRVGC